MSNTRQITAGDILEAVHASSGITTSLTGMTYVAAIMPITNIAFGFLAQVFEHSILGNHVSIGEAYKNGLNYTATVFMVSATIAVATHPAVTEGVHSVASSVCGFFASKNEACADHVSQPNDTQQNAL